jgi:hypothetical protein
MQRNEFSIRDHGETLTFCWQSLYAYVGPTQIIASALVFRLFERAFAELSPGAPPDREHLAFLSGFPGMGIAECVELVTRLRTRHESRYVVNGEAGPQDAPRHPLGRMYFEVQVDGTRRGYFPPRTIFDETFFRNVAAWQGGGGTAAEQEAYFAFKKTLSRRILETPLDKLFSFRDVPPVPLECVEAP